MTEDAGLASYSGPKAGRPGPRDVLALLQRKCELRAMIQELQSQIDLALPHLDQAQTQELLRLAAESSEVEAGPDIVQIQQEAVQASQRITPMDVRLTRPAARAFWAEAVRRLSTGYYCPPTPLLVAEAVRAQFERR